MKSNSIKYDGDEAHGLVVNIAFGRHSEAFDFIKGLQSWNDLHPGMVGAPEITNEYGLLRMDNGILSSHYRAESSDSPDSPASARSVETATTVSLPADWDTKTFQNICPVKLIGGCGLQMCHITDKRFCTGPAGASKNNFFTMSPSFHKQFDGHGFGATPNALITIEKMHNAQVEVATEDGGTELRTREDLGCSLCPRRLLMGVTES